MISVARTVSRKFVMLSLCLLASNSSFAFGSKRLALIYRGPGACQGCPESIAAVLAPLGFKIKFVGPADMTSKAFSEASLYVQPGGSDRLQDTLEVLLDHQIDRLREFVAHGGRFLGVCAGGYLAASTMPDEGKIIKGFGFLPFYAGQEADNPAARVVPVNWLGHSRLMYFQDGPYFAVPSRSHARVVAKYTGSGHVAALVMPFGLGKVGAIGPHPEADADWFHDDHLQVPQKLSADLLQDFIVHLFE